MPESFPTPPMDEILASIRRIITEDPPRVADLPTAAPAAGHPEEDEDVLVLGEAAVVGPKAAVEAPRPTPPAADPAPAPAPRADTDASLLSTGAHEASQRALAALSGLAIDPLAEANTLDGLVREMIRPMLKTWLDANLPDIVERVVTREVARLSGR